MLCAQLRHRVRLPRSPTPPALGTSVAAATRSGFPDLRRHRLLVLRWPPPPQRPRRCPLSPSELHHKRWPRSRRPVSPTPSSLVNSFVVGTMQEEMILICYEFMQVKALVMKRGNNNANPSVPQSSITMLDATLFNFRREDTTLGSSLSNNSSINNNQDSAPASKRRRLSITLI